MMHFDRVHSRPAQRPGGRIQPHSPSVAVGLLLALLALLMAGCSQGNTSQNASTHRQTIQTQSGKSITYSTMSQDVLIRLFYGGGKVDTLELSPDVSIYGDGSFILGSALQLQKGTLSNEQLQNLLHTLTSTDNLLQLQRQTFSDIPDENVTLLQLALNGKNEQFVYGPFGNLQESSQDMREYQQLGNAITSIRNALQGPLKTYTSRNMALLAYQTFRQDFTSDQNESIPLWNLTSIDLANAAIYECGTVPEDDTGPNADTGCLVYTAPELAVLLNAQDLQSIQDLLAHHSQGLLQENGNYYMVMLRPLLPDELAGNALTMLGSDLQSYASNRVPLKSGAIPVPQNPS